MADLPDYFMGGLFQNCARRTGPLLFARRADAGIGHGGGADGLATAPVAAPLSGVGVAGGLALLSGLTPHLLIAPIYQASMPLDSLPVTATPLDLRFGEAMHLIGYEMTPTTLAPSTPVELTLYWRALQPMASNYSIGIKAFGQALRYPTVALDDSYPDAGRWATMYWPADKIIVDRWRIWMSGESVTPTLGRLTVEVYELNQQSGQAGPPLPIVAGGVTVASPVQIGALVVRDTAPPCLPRTTRFSLSARRSR